jgi:hypothetical protein
LSRNCKCCQRISIAKNKKSLIEAFRVATKSQSEDYCRTKS